MRAQACTTLVRPVLEYASTVWDPHQIEQIQRLEQVQRQAARFATGNYYSRDPGCITNMLNNLKWEPLQHRRVKSKVIMLYEIIHHEVEIPLHNLLVTNTRVTRGTQANSIRQISTRVDVYKFSFLPSTITVWNCLPPTVRAGPLSGQLPTGHPDTGPCCEHQTLDCLFLTVFKLYRTKLF